MILCRGYKSCGFLAQAILGFFFKIGSPGLFEDIPLSEGDWEKANHTRGFIMEKYETTAINCWVACGIYVVILIFSIIQQRMNSRNNYEMS